MFKAQIHVTFKKGVLDPQGQTVARSLGSLGFSGIKEARIGRFIEIVMEGDSEAGVREAVVDMCRQMLANPVLEEFEVEITPLDAGSHSSGADGADS